jgi:D-alanyl-D-alanine carboxypeptidase/D-alanyl-D-alanine-endopeptidase (penicillin-binding protein 4)
MTSLFRGAALLAAILLLPVGPATAQKLARRLDARLDAPGLDRLLWGVSVTDLDGRVLYSRNGDRLFVPASNTKILASVAATALLGPHFTVKTSLYGTGPVDNGILRGDLILYGRGDPTFSRRCYQADTTAAGACDTDPAAKLRDLATQLRARGVRAVAGSLIGDGSYFEETLIQANWQSYDLGWWYAAPVSGLGFNDNSLDVHETAADSVGFPPLISFVPDLGIATFENRAHTGDRNARRTFDVIRSPAGDHFMSIGVLPLGTVNRLEYAAIADPNRFAALALLHELNAAGITVRGDVRSTTDSLAYPTARSGTPLAEVTSRPLRDWLFPILSSSQNWFAEMLLKQLGRQFGGAGSWAAGIGVERRFMIDSVHADSTQFVVEDGSGLASNNLVSPHTFTALLAYVARHPDFPMFYDGLSVGGKSGTLKTRFANSPAEGKVHAKTGTISRTATISGFIDRPDGQRLIFSVMANHNNLPSARILAAIDSVVVEIGRPDKPSRRP